MKMNLCVRILKQIDIVTYLNKQINEWLNKNIIPYIKISTCVYMDNNNCFNKALQAKICKFIFDFDK